MIVAKFITERATMGETRTYEDFYKFLGTKPHRLGVVTRLYPWLTASYLTESLQNIVYREAKPKDRYTAIDSLLFEWEIDVNHIVRPKIVSVTPNGGHEYTMVFDTKWYFKYDTFVNEASRQQYLVLSNPVRKSDKEWEVIVDIIDNDWSSELAAEPGDVTHWISNAHPELHDEGHIKYQSNFEKARNYITTFRVDDSFSSLYALHEDQFIKIAEGKNKGEMSEQYYKMSKKEKVLLDNFLTARNQGLLFNKSNIDVNGKARQQDPATNRQIPIGEGIIPQIERFASKYNYAKMTKSVFDTVLQTLNAKADKPTGNKYTFIVNEKAWNDIQNALGDLLINAHTDGSWMYSKAKDAYVKVGAAFNSYAWGGNEINFIVDRAFSLEFGQDKGYCLALDLTADLSSGHAPMEMFSLKGKDIVTNKFVGVGGLSGGDNGEVASPVAGSRLIIHGYAGIGVFAPHKSFIMREL